MGRKFVLYHGDCLDGFGASYAAWLILGDTATYLPCRYGDDPPELPMDADVTIVDFSFKRPVLESLKARVATLQVIDHHRTAQEDLAGLAYARFDMTKSGAVLAWEYFHPGQPVPMLLLYIQDRDLWQWKLPKSREVNAAISSYPNDHVVWGRELDHGSLAHLATQGSAIVRAQSQQIAANIKLAYLSMVSGHVVPVVNTNAEISMTCNELLRQLPQYPFAALYFDHPSGQRKWSLRSVGDFDVSGIAKLFGGGGHKNAAGFEQPPPMDPVTYIGTIW